MAKLLGPRGWRVKSNYCHSISSQRKRDRKDRQAEERRGKEVPSPLLKGNPRGWIA